MCSSLNFNTCTDWCGYNHNWDTERFHHIQLTPSYLSPTCDSWQPLIFSPWLQADSLPTEPLGKPCLKMPSKWDHIVYNLLRLECFCDSSKLCDLIVWFFLLPTVLLCMDISYFVNSGHMGCFQFFMIVNRATINIWVQIFCLFVAVLYSMWDLSSITRDRTCGPCSGRVEF